MLRPDATSRWRRRIYDLLENTHAGDRWARRMHRAIIALILFNVVAVVLESVPSLAAEHGRLFAAIEVVSVILFGFEFVLRVWSSVEHPPFRMMPPGRARLRYLRQPSAIIDMLALFPFLLAAFVPTDLRAILLLRLVRYFKLARYSPGMVSLMDAVWRERRALGACLVILFGAVLLAASFMHFAEHHVQPDKFGTIPDAMYWAMITLTTVGYGDVVPVTPLGKAVAAITAVAGLVMLALPVGIIASAFAREIHRRDFVVTWSLVARVPLFSGLGAADVAEIMRALTARAVGPGELVCRRGEPAHSMYFIAAGEVEVELPDQRVRLRDGHFFGEMAVLRRANRSATVRATEVTKLLVLDAQDLQVILTAHPDIARHIDKVMRDRLGSERIGVGGDLVTEEIVADDEGR